VTLRCAASWPSARRHAVDRCQLVDATMHGAAMDPAVRRALAFALVPQLFYSPGGNPTAKRRAVELGGTRRRHKASRLVSERDRPLLTRLATLGRARV
jgi:hypothetical protein